MKVTDALVFNGDSGDVIVLTLDVPQEVDGTEYVKMNTVQESGQGERWCKIVLGVTPRVLNCKQPRMH